MAMTEPHTVTETRMDRVTPPLGHAEIMALARAAVQDAVAEHLAAGFPVFSCGIGEAAEKLFMLMPDGRRFEYRMREDGTREIIRELAPE